MKVIEYIKEHGLEKTIEDHKLKSVYHEELPLVILNYDQIESPKCDPIVMECRGLILELDTWKIICRPMHRFFNEGEALDITSKFNWNDFITLSKEDGSLIHQWMYRGKIHISTRGSFGNGICGISGKSWKELVAPLIPEVMGDILRTGSAKTNVFEFCSMHNKIVRIYKEPCVYWITTNDNETGKGMSEDAKKIFRSVRSLKFPERFDVKSLDELHALITDKSEHDQTFEGVVVTDSNGLKIKIKSPTYVALHRLRGEGDNMFMPKNLLPFIILGETDELLCYFPEVREQLEKYEIKYNELVQELVNTWNEFHGIEDQKEFAKAIKDVPCNWILFQERKTGKSISDIINDNQDKIIKYLK